MGIECKVCLSEKRDYIEQLILQGNSNLTISATMKDMNEDISHASIGRHKTKHMPDYADTVKENAGEKGNRKYDREDSKNAFAINASGIYDEIRKLALHSVNYDELAKNNFMLQLMLNRIVNNQMAITIDLQEKYMSGDSKYPNEQIRGLQIVQEIMQKFEVYTRQNFQHYNKLANSKSGISNHIYELGKKAKREANIINPYIKGTIFKIMIDDSDIMEYYRIYFPKNPYSDDDLFNGHQEYVTFENGVKEERSIDERLDYKLYNLLCNNAIGEKRYYKCLKAYTENDYDAIKEIRRLEKIVKAYRETDNDDEWNDDDEID